MTLKTHIWNHREVGVAVRVTQQNLHFQTGKNLKPNSLLSMVSPLNKNGTAICYYGPCLLHTGSSHLGTYVRVWSLGPRKVPGGERSREQKMLGQKQEKVRGGWLETRASKQIQNWIPLGRGNESKMLKFLQRTRCNGGRRVRRGWGMQVVIWGSLYSMEENTHE